jgi:hypothetical protein
MQNLTRLNKKGDKVVLSNKTRLLGLSAKSLEFGIPLSYVAYKYGLFTYKNAGYAVTGGTIFGVIIAYAFAQNSIKEWVKKNKDELSDTYKRAKWVGVWLGLAAFVGIGSIFLEALLGLFISGAIGVGSSLWFWKHYDNAIIKKDRLNEILKEDVHNEELEELKQLRIEQLQKKLDKKSL